VVCGRNGPWVAGAAIDDPERIRSWLGDDIPVLYRYVGTEWRQIDLPPPLPNPDGSKPDRLGVAALAEDGEGRLWMTYWREPDRVTDPIYSFDGERWTTYELPEVPSVAWYDVTGIAFDDRGEGWAIANLYGSAVHPESHGILLRFRDGQWRLQNWKWPFWRQRWWGLFG
jgi:hypothetical protein